MPNYEAHILSWFLTWITELFVALFFFPLSGRLVFTVIILNTLTQPLVFAVTGKLYDVYGFRPYLYGCFWIGIELMALIAEMFGWRILYPARYRKCLGVASATNVVTASMSFII
jgi:hypothetical protein